jgi:methylase of polypeptide subunit release factors
MLTMGVGDVAGYLLPNDEREKNRLDIFHHLCGLLFGGKLHLAPIGAKPQRILDVGTGTGIWAIDMGKQL